MAKDKNIKILGWEKKPKSLVRYLNAGDYFAYQIGEGLYGWGQLLARNDLGWSAIFFKYLTDNADNFDINNPEQQERLFITIVDAYRLFQDKSYGDFRIIVQVKIFDNPYKNEFVSIDGETSSLRNPDFSVTKKISDEEIDAIATKKPEVFETQRAYDLLIELLVHYVPEIFKPEHRPFLLEKYLLKVFERKGKPKPF